MTLMVLMASLPRNPENITIAAISEALQCPIIEQVHVWGFDPTGKAHHHALRTTLYHRALKTYQHDLTRNVLTGTGKFAITDTLERTLWRAKLALDMWYVLKTGRELFPKQTLLYLENDAIVDCKMLTLAYLELTANNYKALSCWGKGKVWDGSGTLCFLLTPSIAPERHLLAYHMVQPADWIMSDYSNGTWPVLPCVTHGFNGRHKSTYIKYSAAIGAT